MGQRYLLGVWIVMGVVTPLLGYLGARGFAPAVGLMGLLCLGCLRPKSADWLAFGLWGLLVAWAFASMLWSPFDALKGHGLKALGGFTALHIGYQVVLSGAFVMAAGRLGQPAAQGAIRWLSYGLLALGAILVIEGVTQAAIYQRLQGVIHNTVRPDFAVRNVAQGGYVLAALLWPAAIALRRSGRLALALFLGAAVIYSTFALRGDSPTLALGASLLAFFLVRALGRAAVYGLGALTAAYWLLTPLAMLGASDLGLFQAIYGRLPPSWDKRLEIWTFTLGKWLDAPLRGAGLDASRAYPRLIPLHPHDGALQAWYELGAPGAILIAGFWVFLFWRIGKAADDRLFAATACATATVYLVIGAISFSLWQEWWLCLGAFALAACIALRRVLESEPAAGWVPLQSDPPAAG
jgi:O-antigen ligase